MNIEMNKNMTKNKKERIIYISRPLYYLIIAIISLFSSSVTYHFLYEYLYAQQWWKYLSPIKLIMTFIISSIFLSLLFKIGKRLFHCSMSIQIMIYSIVTIVSIYRIHYQNIPRIFLNKYIFYNPQYLNLSLFFVIYYILLLFGISLMSIIGDSINLVLSFKLKNEAEDKLAKMSEHVSPYKMPDYIDYQNRLLSSDEKKSRKIFIIILLSLLFTILIINLLGLRLETKGIYYRAWITYLVHMIYRFIIPLLLVSYFILRLLLCKRETSDKVNKYIIKRELLLLIVGLGMFLFMVTSGYQLMYKTTIDKESKIGEYYIMSDNQYLFGESYSTLTYYNHYNLFIKSKYSDDIQLIKVILNDRYHEDFSINSDNVYPYNFIAKSKSSDFEFYVIKDDHNNYDDYYRMTKFYDYIQDYIDEHQIQLEIDPKRDNLLYGIKVYINDDDLENRAKELSVMISDLIKDEYFNTEGNCVEIVVDFDKNKYYDNYVTLTLGDQYSKQNEYSKEYYTNYDNVYNQLISVYSKNIDSTDKAEELLIEDVSEFQKGEFFTYMADLTHDGIDETVIIDIFDISKNKQLAANIYVNDVNGSTIWEQEAYLPSAGWTTCYICNIDGESYLLFYMPSIGQGTGHYEYHLFYLDDDDGRELIISENEINFDSYPTSEVINLPVDEMVSFANEVNQYFNQGYLLLSTWDGLLQYSTPDEEIILQENYDNLDYPIANAKPEDLSERLNQYKEYLKEIWKEINLIDLSTYEYMIFEKFRSDYDDDSLIGLTPISICKMYLYAGITGDYETQYELYTTDEDYVVMTKDEFLNIPDEERMYDFEFFKDVYDLSVTSYSDSATISWKSKNGYFDEQLGAFIYGFTLRKDGEVWKVNFYPLA